MLQPESPVGEFRSGEYHVVEIVDGRGLSARFTTRPANLVGRIIPPAAPERAVARARRSAATRLEWPDHFGGSAAQYVTSRKKGEGRAPLILPLLGPFAPAAEGLTAILSG